MNPIFLLCLSNLRKKKVQNVVIAFIIFLSTLILSTAVLVMSNTKNVFMDVHDRTNGSQQILNFEHGLYNPERVYEWWSKQDGVTASQLFQYRSLSVFEHNGQEVSNITLYVMDSGTSPKQSQVDKLLFAEGGESPAPEEGSVWIPTSLAYSKGIKLGDEIGIKADSKLVKLKVSAIAVDVPFSQPFTVTARLWMNTHDYEHYMSANGQSNKAIMGLRFNDINEQGAYWQRFEQEFKAPFLESLTDFQGISSFYLIIGNIISFIMIFFAIIMIMIALYSIGFTIIDAIISNYKSIGIIQSLGLKPRQVIQVYVMQYSLLALVSIVPAIAISYSISKMIIGMTLAYLKTNDTIHGIEFSNYALYVAVFVLGLTSLLSYIVARRASRINPAQAIRYGMSEKQQSKSARWMIASSSWIDRLPVTISVGIREIVKNKGGSLFLILITTLTTAVLAIGITFISSIATMDPSKWGYDNTDISLEILDQSKLSIDTVQQDLSADPRVRSINSIGGMYGVIPIKGQQAAESSSSGVYITTISGNPDDLGLANIDGRNPIHENEISIGARVSDLLNKGVGDTMEIYIQGHKGTYTISGVYQAITNMSVSVRITSEAIDRLGLETSPSDTLFFLNLHNGVSQEQFVDEMRKQYGESILIASQKTLIKETFSQAVNILILPMSIMGLFIIVVAFGITFSTSRINIKKDSRKMGIYQSLGMMSRKIRLSVALGTILLAGIGACIGLPAGIVSVPMFFNAVLSNYGIVEFPVNYDWLPLIIMVPIGMISVGFGSWFASRVIRRKSLRFLVED